MELFNMTKSNSDNHKQNFLQKFNALENEILSIHYYEDDKEGYIIVGGNLKEITVYHIRTGDHQKWLEGHTDSVTCMTNEEKMLFTGSDDCTIKLWNM
jgi:WD40 repeat protein